MAIFRHTDDLPEDARHAVVAVGNFDGVHRGHQSVIAEAAAEARRLHAPLGVLTFEPHPRQVFQPDLPPFRLTPLRIKARVLESLGVDHLYVLHFDWDLAAKTAEAFVRDILVRDLSARHVVTGWNFRFGNKRRGDAQLLRELAQEGGYGVTTVEPVAGEGGEVFSSSRVREALVEGQPEEAARLLGRAWEIEGRVEHGDKRGRTIGFPTANVALGEYLVPALGVYAVRAGIDEGQQTDWANGVANLGRRPTVDGTRVQLEVHIFDRKPELYGAHLRVQLLHYLRGEKKFDGLDALRAQIARDCEEARSRLEGRACTPGEAPQ
ncbi:MAG: bifunctional riboflavin kinase/FAD synthetase [Rhodovibrionaceae bacterium]|nr:bifunctional riboflavin kinase/FAD synthetase [Rhodovibrionaceae bacterium]